MKIIKKLTRQMKDELYDAEKYIKCAEEYKAEFPPLAETYAKLSHQECDHAMFLHEQAVKIIDNYKKQSEVGPPAYMREMWKDEHEEIMDKAAEIKVRQDMYSNGK